MDTQSQNSGDQQNGEVQKNEGTQHENLQNSSGNTDKPKKKYHSSALYATTLIRESVGHVKPHNHTGLDL